ncbi:uncharacterized protein PG986_001766 [Apiospora aurea]|uniref:Nascent polypeptide-associated complex subunit alpha-like UBA domain-containing protein n=1 Tax=Apiospora aurea TaxID=335848 RepID=A0ABR1QXX5_9PEZI
MAEHQPPNLHEGATTGDVEDEVQAAKSAEDRKAAAAMASMGSNGADDANGSTAVDQEAASKAMQSLGGEANKSAAAVQKKVKVDAADVTLLVDQLDLTKPKATELLKAHDGDAVKAMKASIAV